ncbi:MAG: hypothetical protein L3J47_09355, partial [Sulfurovum sp.]|nr:hypothetical protein [Sulfurovum sp.]
MHLRTLIFSITLIILTPALFAQTKEKLPDGYIKLQALPDSVRIVPPVPMPKSPRQILDDAISQKALKLNTTPRFQLAAHDATMHFPEAPNSFACAMGKLVSKEKTPRLFHLLKRSGVDAGYATRKAK